MDSTSASLLLRLKQPQADAAWERFVELYAPLIFYWGRKQALSATDAADLVQEVLTILLVKLPEFDYDPARRFRGWLRTIVVNQACDFHRRAVRRPRTGQDGALHRTAAMPTADLLDEAEYRSFVVNRALDLMRGEFRDETWQACWKQVVEGRKAREVAQELGISLNQAYLAKSRVLARLREELDGLME